MDGAVVGTFIWVGPSILLRREACCHGAGPAAIFNHGCSSTWPPPCREPSGTGGWRSGSASAALPSNVHHQEPGRAGAAPSAAGRGRCPRLRSCGAAEETEALPACVCISLRRVGPTAAALLNAEAPPQREPAARLFFFSCLAVISCVAVQARPRPSAARALREAD